MKKMNENTKVTLTIGQLKKLVEEARVTLPDFDPTAMKDALKEIASRSGQYPGKFNRDTMYSGKTWTSYIWTSMDDSVTPPTTKEIRDKYNLPEAVLQTWRDEYGVRFPADYEYIFRDTYKSTKPAKRTAASNIEEAVAEIAVLLDSKGVKYKIERQFYSNSQHPWIFDADKTKVSMEEIQKILQAKNLPCEIKKDDYWNELIISGPIGVQTHDNWNVIRISFPHNADIKLVKATIAKLKKERGLDKITYQECPDSVKKDIESDIVDFIEEDKIWNPDVSFSFDVERGTASIDVHGGSKAYGDSYTIHKWATGRYNPHNKTYRIVDSRYRRRTRGGGFGDGERDWKDDDPLKLCNIVKQAFNDASLTSPVSISISINVYYD